MKKYRRRPYAVISRSNQYRFLAYILFYNILIVACLAGFLLVPDILQMEDPSMRIEVQAAAAERILTMHARIWPTVIALVCLIGLHFFRVFLRVMGPLYRFQQVFGQVGGGDLSLQVRLRQKDLLHSEAETFNKMVASFSEQIGNVKQAGFEALDSFMGLEKQLALDHQDEGDIEKIELLRSHRHKLENILETVKYFKLGKDDGGLFETETPRVDPRGGPPTQHANAPVYR